MEERRRILITGVSRFLGLRLAKRFENDDSVEKVIGVDVEEPPVPIDNFEFVRVDIRSPLIARVLSACECDTLVHTNISSTPSVLGGRSQMKENNVIGTMQLLAAAQRTESLRTVVVRSSTAIYGSGPGEPSLLPEDHAAHQVELSGYAKDCADAETYARDFGRRRPDVDLVILRTQNVIGPTVRTNIAQYLSLPLVPTALGYDPRLQLLHEVDAVEALHRAVVAGTRGIFNIAADGVVYLSKAIRLLGRVQVPLMVAAATPVASALRSLNAVDFPTDQLRLLLFGRVVNTRRAKDTLGFAPRFSTEAALIDFRDHRSLEPEPVTTSHPSWERELLQYLRSRPTESVR